MDTLGVQKGDRLVAKKVGKKVILEPAGKGILAFAGKFGTVKIPKGKTVDDLIHEATREMAGDALR